MQRIAVYAGSFDPPTFGHQDIARRALRICDTLIVAVGRNPEKKSSMFSVEERLDMLEHLFKPYPEIRVAAFEGLLVEYCRIEKAHTIIRGLRAVTEFESELGMASINAEQAGEDHGLPKIDTVFIPATNPRFSFVSSSSVRILAVNKGSLERYVDPYVETRLREKLNGGRLQGSHPNPPVTTTK